MTMTHRILIALGIITVDVAVFILPLSGFFLAYVLVFNPPWFREFIHRLDDSSG